MHVIGSHRALRLDGSIWVWASLTSVAAMLHAMFHQASPFVPQVIFLAKNLPHVAFMRSRRSLLAPVSDGMSVIKGHGNKANEAIHSHFITFTIFHPISDGGGVGGISRGRLRKRAAWSKEIDWLKDTEHVLGKNGLARNGRFTKKWSIRDGRPALPRQVNNPSRMRDKRSSHSIHDLS